MLMTKTEGFKTDVSRLFVENILERTLSRLHESPKREIRNLVDMGLNFSRGRFQKRFLQTVQKMLKNPQSAYYTLVQDLAGNVDRDRILSFGVNLGYEGCTKGARTIRAQEKKRGFCIPWFLTLAVSEKKLEEEPEFYPSVVEQGIELGIHTYLLFSDGDPAKLLPLLQSRKDCAFLLLLRGAQVTDSLLQALKQVKSTAVSICADEDMPAACQKLRQGRFLYAVHRQYTEEESGRILSGEWLESLLPYRPPFVFLAADRSCSQSVQQQVYSYIRSVRDGQTYPLVLMDFRQDMLDIDRVISDDGCTVAFDFEGWLRNQETVFEDECCNLFVNRLDQILETAMPR